MKLIRRYLVRLFIVLIVTFIFSAVFLNNKKDGGTLFNKFQLMTPNSPIHSVLFYNVSTLSGDGQPSCTAKTSLVFVKTHKSGSTTLIATLQKYAYINDLLMMVPMVEYNMFNWPLVFRPNVDNVKAQNNQKFDMLVNHIVFNKTLIAPLMKSDAQYVTILREPIAHLRSAFQYFDVNENGRLGLGVEAFNKFLSDPFKYDKNPQWMKNVIPLAVNRVNSMTRNLQSADLGLSYWDFGKPEVVQKFIERTMDDLHFIVILERMEESLVLLRRHMCWKMQDIIFLSKNVNPHRLFEMRDLPEWARANAYKWNNVDLLLYQAANRRLDTLRQASEGIQEEITAYKSIQQQINQHCWNVLRQKGDKLGLTIAASKWNERFVVDNRFCVLLLLDERDLTHVFKCKQHPEHKDCQKKAGDRVNMTVSMIEGAQAYRHVPMTPRTPS